MSRRQTKLLIAGFLLSGCIWVLLYYKQDNLYELTRLRHEHSGLKRATLLYNATRHEVKSLSYSLWKSIRLPPEHMIGNATHRRYGEHLEVYSRKNNVNDVKATWSFHQQRVTGVDCAGLFLNDAVPPPAEQQTQLTIQMKQDFQTKLDVVKTSCDKYISTSGYVTSTLTNIEASFPIAYSIVLYKDAVQYESLLRLIYRPQNIYCVHVDEKSPPKFKERVEAISNCFDNVFLTSRSANVKWGEFSVLEAELICLKELWSKSIKWKYFINLTGQEIPLRTNYELVKTLTSFNGANNVESVRLSEDRLAQSGTAPQGVIPRKGALHVVLSRDFVDYLLHNETAQQVLQWSQKVVIPDEIFFTTLNYNTLLAAPGSYRGEARTTNDSNPFLGRLKNWRTESHCSGKFVRDICVFGTKDLPLLATREELFANKVHFGYHPEVPLCIEELLYNRTVEEYKGTLEFNVNYYATRDFVKNRF